MRLAERLSQDGRTPNSPFLYYISYVEQWRFRCSMSSGHRERGFLDPRTPWADACDVSGFNSPSTCSHSDDSGGAAAFVPPRTPRSSGYDFLCTCGLCCYMLYVYYMLYACFMSSSEPSPLSPQAAVAVFGYIEGPFLVSRTGCARERHTPCIEGPFLVNRTGHAREHHAP